VSLGNDARSTASTRYPLRASNIAVGEPAQRAPMTMTSNALSIETSLQSFFVPVHGSQAD
jgi:hypothetical protein